MTPLFILFVEGVIRPSRIQITFKCGKEIFSADYSQRNHCHHYTDGDRFDAALLHQADRDIAELLREAVPMWDRLSVRQQLRDNKNLNSTNQHKQKEPEHER